MKLPIILLIEDNSVTRKMVRVTLENEGYRVVEAEDGEHAIRQFVEHRPDMVLQDLLLPDIDGFDLVQHLRSRPHGAEIPILAFSGFPSKVEQARALQVGFTDILLKPVEPAYLVQTVRAYLGSASLMKEKPGKGLRVLAVDDDPVQRKLLAIHLGQLGFHVRTAVDGTEALEAARRHPPDAIVSDVLMPGLDGYRLCQAIRRDPQLSRIPVVLVSSAYDEEADRRLAVDMGANAFLIRDPDCQRLGEALCASMEKPRRLAPPEPLDWRDAYLRRVVRQLDRQASLNVSLSQRLQRLTETLREREEQLRLLLCSRREAVEPQVLELNAVMMGLHPRLRRLVGEEIDLLILPDPEAGRVKVDPGQIEQVVLNLVVNARDAMPRGGKLILAMKSIDLDVQYAHRSAGHSPGAHVMLAVSDTGCGMDAQTQSRIFDPFFTTKEEGRGTGLGLPIVQGIVRQSGGHVRVESTPGQGSTFRIYLPRTQEPVSPQPGRERPEAIPVG